MSIKISKSGGWNLRYMHQCMSLPQAFEIKDILICQVAKILLSIQLLRKSKNKKKSNKMNVIVIANLTMAFKSELLVGMVYQSRTTKWPSGLDHMVVDALFKKRFPQDLVSKIGLLRALNAVSMKKEEFPVNLFDMISRINNKYNTATYKFT